MSEREDKPRLGPAVKMEEIERHWKEVSETSQEIDALRGTLVLLDQLREAWNIRWNIRLMGIERPDPKSFVRLTQLYFVEYAYQRVGRWKGVNGTRNAQEENLRYWTSLGADGAAYLVDRIRGETDIDVLAGVSNALAEIGVPAVTYIINALREGRDHYPKDAAEALFRALSWMKLPADCAETLSSILDYFFADTDPDVRDAAYNATSALPEDASRVLWQRALETEADPDLREVLSGLLTRSET